MWVECHGVECVEKPGGWIVHELNVSEVVCAGVECVGVEKVKSGVESKSWISRSGVVLLPLFNIQNYSHSLSLYVSCKYLGFSGYHYHILRS
jgi:hypothetical protein